MRSITKRLIGSGLATTKIHFFCFRCLVHDRAKGCAFMGSVTEGLFFTLTALTPVIGFSLFHFNGIGRFLCNNRFIVHQYSFQNCLFCICTLYYHQPRGMFNINTCASDNYVTQNTFLLKNC